MSGYLDPSRVWESYVRRTAKTLAEAGCPWTPENGCPPCIADNNRGNCRIADELNAASNTAKDEGR